MDPEKKELGAWWVWMLALLVLSGIVFGILNSFGLVGRTIVEREVFKRSFQYSEARKSEITVYEATLSEIERKLLNSDLDKNIRTNLEAQASAIRIQLYSARRKR